MNFLHGENIFPIYATDVVLMPKCGCGDKDWLFFILMLVLQFRLTCEGSVAPHSHCSSLGDLE